MDFRPSRLLLVLALALFATGCAFNKPTLRFKDARATEVDLEGATLQLTFALKNPNPIGFKLDTIRYKLEVEGKHVVSGQPPEGVTVAAQGSSDLVFPARIKFLDIVPTVDALLKKNKVNYRASGAVGIRTPIGPLELPMSYEGSFEVPKMPAFTFQPPRLASISFQGARIVFPVQIQNKNSFPLPLGGVSASFAIAGQNVGTVQAPTQQYLAGSQAQVIEIPLDINFLQAGFAVASAIQSKSAQVQLKGALKSGEVSIPINLNERLNFK
ncbi:MAG TPA: LEA type 2 family protein [Myxococcales bacterium]|jgi:LEA14-like dessication related protein